MEDEQIVLLLLERKEQAVEEIEKIYGKRLRNIALAILDSREDADECVNDTLWKAWRAIPPAKPIILSAFLEKVCRNTAFDRLNYRGAGKRQGRLVELTAEMEQCIPDQKADIQAKGRELAALLNQFLEELPQEKRLLFMRRYWFGDSVREIAERYKISESKVKTSLFRTRRYLKKYLEKENYKI